MIMVAFNSDDIYRLWQEEDWEALKVVLFQLKDDELNELIEEWTDEEACKYLEDYLARRQKLMMIL